MSLFEQPSRAYLCNLILEIFRIQDVIRAPIHGFSIGNRKQIAYELDIFKFPIFIYVNTIIMEKPTDFAISDKRISDYETFKTNATDLTKSLIKRINLFSPFHKTSHVF